MTPIRLLLAFLCLGAIPVMAQQSDYEVHQQFEQRSTALRQKIDSAATPGELDALKTQIDALAIDFQEHKEFLDKALYPDTFDGRIDALRQLYTMAYNRTSTIQNQTARITELESTVSQLTGRLDTLTGERARLFSDLQAAKSSLAALRETVKRLTSNLQANERLVFSLVDSIFLPYDRNLRQGSDIAKEDIAGKLQQANVLTRVYDVAADNARFLQSTQLQPKDFGNLFDQYQQFKTRWSGLSDKMHDVAAAAERRAALESPAGAAKGGPPARGEQLAASVSAKGAQVDSAMRRWNASLMGAFWSAVEKEFTAKGIQVNHFTDGPSFSAAVRSLVATYKTGGADPDPFVKEVWKDRIDKEWRDALSRDAVLGKAEYASLDQTVSELTRKTVDLKLILYIVGIIVIALVIWRLVTRRSRAPRDEGAAQ
ncbi:MAG TPA: hypothetical protein VF889_08440 [Bacteroidota bacterium]